ncbi:DUF6844 domain-containing protein [Marinobacterium arenosum]|uniref:DUF6844 domain-containing protein n=1 Tax=Marinobacterium arenosum TaxID=2862496 RepID=UPI001C97A2EB|nr:hypothetical protein [Marinobacterium arenosum]MBY4675525.1 hypothetical protein [Marinobacterium arenosum]
MKKIFTTPLLVASLSTLSGAAMAATAAEQPTAVQASPEHAAADAQVQAEIAEAATPDFDDPGLKIEELLEQFNTSGLGSTFRARAERGELYYGTGSALVMGKPESRDWGNFRVMAYKEALLKAQADYVKSLGVSVTAESASKLFDDKTQMPQFTAEELNNSSKWMELLNKAMAVAGGKLDRQLEELGIDPSQFNAAPPAKRALIYQRAVEERVITRARQSLSGVIPVKTFEAHDANGNHAVAVAIVASDRFRQFVEDVLDSKGDIAPNPARAGGPTLLEQLQGDKRALLDEFGIRRLYDEQGYPVLVSFGQASNPYRGNDYQQRADKRELSYAAADSQAYGNFAYLFNATGSYRSDDSSKAARSTTGIAHKEQDGVNEIEQRSLEFVQTIDRQIQARGSMSNQPGIKKLFQWTAKHPLYGHEINGVVYAWHPRTEQLARDLKNPQRQRDKASEQTSKVTGTAGTSSSPDRMRADDF